MIGIYRTYTLGGILKWAFFVLIAIALLWYGAFQARFLIAGPSLSLSPDTAVLQTERTITVTGVAQNVTSITLNDRAIFTDDQGVFREQLVLENGYTIMTLRSEDRYGRTAVLTHPFVYAPAYTPDVPQP